MSLEEPRVGPRTALRHELRTWGVAALAAAAAALQLAGGALTRSAAVAGEGLHALAHVAAFALAGLAYALGRWLAARGRSRLARLAPDLAGALNGALLLALAAELGAVSTSRLLGHAAPAAFGPTLALAVFGLLVNLASALVLRHSHAHEHGHSADVNFRGVYLHVLGDTAVAGLAIVGVLSAKGLGAVWADPAAGAVGAILVAAFGVRLLLAGAGAVLADARESRRGG